jgi:predicted acyltransferase
MGAMAHLMTVHLAMHHGGLFTRLDLDHKPWLGPATRAIEGLSRGIDALESYVGLGDATGSLAAIAMAGCLLGTLLRRDSDVNTPRDRLSWAATFVVGLLVAGFLTDTLEGINKIAATPTWCLWSAALACTAWAFLFLLMDVAGLRGWSILVRPAGANPLVAYFLHPIVVGLILLAGLGDRLLAYQEAAEPWKVIGGSLGMALFVNIVTGLLGRLGLRARL